MTSVNAPVPARDLRASELYVPRSPSLMVIGEAAETRSLLSQELGARGYEVTAHAEWLRGLRAAQLENPDLLVIDDLAGITGPDLCARIRAWSSAPVVMVSGRDDVEERIRGLRAGADDYVQKPFVAAELAERIAAILRRCMPEARQFRFEDLTLDVERHRCFRDGREIMLTPTEFAILEVLARLPGRVISRQTIASVVWPESEYIDDRMLDSHITHLRTKLEAGGGRRIVRTVRGVGLSLQ